MKGVHHAKLQPLDNLLLLPVAKRAGELEEPAMSDHIISQLAKVLLLPVSEHKLV